MQKNNLIERLENRGFITQITDKKALIKQLAKGSITLYCGFDPTADSLHLGHLVPLLCLKHFQLAGHKPIVLVGGATGLIGDPSFKTKQRQLQQEELIQNWSEKIRKQIAKFLDLNCGINSAIIDNNYNWFGNMNILPFLRDIGKYFSINQMINKEAIKQRLNHEDHGISFTEFSYSLLQGYDFANLNKLYGVTLQIGGSDQWGNITSGITLTRRLYKNHVFGLTVPLITKTNGTKFGKTENSTVWLDPKKTNPYKFYQFWINTSDDNIYRFLKLFTFMDIEEINNLEKEQNNNKNQNAQCILAEYITHLVHGKKEMSVAKRITKYLFNDTLNNLKETDFEQIEQSGMLTVRMNKNTNLIQALVNSQLQPSYTQARRIISSNAISINGKKQTDPGYIFQDSDRLFGRYTLLRRGKKNFCLVHWK